MSFGASIILIVVAIVFRQRILPVLGTLLGVIAPFVVAPIRWGFRMARRWGFRAALTAGILATLAAAFWTYGLTAHNAGYVLAAGLLLEIGFGLLWLYAEATLGYFGVLFQVARASANLLVRIIHRLFVNLELAKNGPAPELGDIVPWAEKRLRSIARTIMIVVGVWTLGFALRPAWSTYQTWLFGLLAAVAFILMAAEWNYNTRTGRIIVAKSTLVALAAAAYAFVLLVAAWSLPERFTRKVTACGAHAISCGAAVVTGQPFDALAESYADEARAAFEQEEAASLATVNTVRARGLITNEQFDTLRMAAVSAQRDREIALRAPHAAKNARLIPSERVELGGYLAIWFALAIIALWILVAILRADLEASGAPAASNTTGKKTSPFAIAGAVALVAAVLAGLVFLGYAIFSGDEKPVAVAAAPAPAAAPVASVPVQTVVVAPPAPPCEEAPPGLCREVYQPAWRCTPRARREAWCLAAHGLATLDASMRSYPLPR